MRVLESYFKGDYLFHVCQADAFLFTYKTGYVTLPEGHPATGMHYDDLPELNLTFSRIDFENRWTFGFDTASQSGIKEFQTTSYIKERLAEIHSILNQMEGGVIPNEHEEPELTDEEQAQQDRMLDDMLEDYRNRLVIPQYISDEADRLEC